MSKPFIVAVTGGASSGKNRVCRSIQDELAQFHHNEDVTIIMQEYFYRDLTDHQKKDIQSVNFDHPCLISVFSIQGKIFETKLYQRICQSFLFLESMSTECKGLLIINTVSGVNGQFFEFFFPLLFFFFVFMHLL